MQIFAINSNDINGRLDCYYYQPSFIEFENKISKHTNKTLADFIISMAGGATPDKDQKDKYYTDTHTGIPFIRVQNLSSEGLDLSDVKYINKSTHDRMLRRSQVKENDLLVKITGVGRMAVSSVAPKGFIGNINQHIVVIKTKDKASSDYLAMFLNSDVGETLAKRRSTGGTRPALDYEALKSIPIVWKPQIVEIMKTAYQQKQQKEKEAQKLLDSIDVYVLNELSIQMPEIKNEMTFIVNSDEVKGIRIDPYYYRTSFKEVYKMLAELKNVARLKDLIEELDYGLMPTQDYAQTEKEGVPMIRVTNIMPDGSIDMSDTKFIPFDTPRLDVKRVKENDILMVQCGSTTGKVAFVPKHYEGYTFGSFSFVIRGNNKIVNQKYLFAILLSQLVQLQIKRTWNIVTVRPNTSKPNVENLLIPLPSLAIQEKIASEVENKMLQAKRLQQEALQGLQIAKKQVEKIILSGN